MYRELAGQCQIVMENFKVGDMARYGLDYPSLSALYPRWETTPPSLPSSTPPSLPSTTPPSLPSTQGGRYGTLYMARKVGEI